MNPLECAWDVSRFLIVSSNGEPLIYYSHLTSIAIFLGLIGFTFLKLRPWPKESFRLMALSYVVWLFCDLVLWANEIPDHIVFFWTLINLVEPLIFVFAYTYFLQFVDNKPLGIRTKWIIFGLLVPTLVMAPIGLSVVGFDMTTCDRNVVEGVAAYYNYFLEALFFLLIALKTVQHFRKLTLAKERTKLLLTAFGTLFLMLSFLVANFLGTITGDYLTSQYGHIAVPVFAAFLAYLTIKYESFEPRILFIDTLVVALFILLASRFFVQDPDYRVYTNLLTIVLMLPLGYSLMKGIRVEVRARRDIQKLADELQRVNSQQVILIHFITHQIKGFVAKSRNIFSLLLDGDFGAVPEKMRPMIEEGFRSDTRGAQTIQEILNAANIKSGKVVYSMAACDLKALVLEIAKELEPAATAKGLEIIYDLAADQVTVSADRAQLTNAIKNLIDNSIKYTPTGSVMLSLKTSEEKAIFTVQDTGVGITAEDMNNLFTEGGRGKNSQKINVESTGFGLYIVKNIIEAHKGRVWAESEGTGKGSRFIVELPV